MFWYTYKDTAIIQCLVLCSLIWTFNSAVFDACWDFCELFGDIDHVTPLLHDLHWLKVPERVTYRLAVTVYRCLHGMALPYLCDGLQHVAELNRRRLRSSMSNALVVPATRLVTVGDRAFPVASSRLWNSLSTDVTSATTLPVFCSRLKTFIFCFFPCMICVV